MSRVNKIKMVLGNNISIYELDRKKDTFLYIWKCKVYNQNNEVILDLEKCNYTTDIGVRLITYKTPQLFGFWVLDDNGNNRDAEVNISCIVTLEGKKIYKGIDVEVTSADCLIGKTHKRGIRVYSTQTKIESIVQRKEAWADKIDKVYFSEEDVLNIETGTGLVDKVTHYNADEAYPIYIGNKDKENFIVNAAIMPVFDGMIYLTNNRSIKVSLFGETTEEIEKQISENIATKVTKLVKRNSNVYAGINARIITFSRKDTGVRVRYRDNSEIRETEEGKTIITREMQINYFSHRDIKKINGRLEIKTDGKEVEIEYKETGAECIKETDADF